MGVPAFFRWLSRKYPSVIIECMEDRPPEVDGVRPPVDTTQPNPNEVQNSPHLAKRTSDLKQNGTQEKTPFYGTVFRTLSHDVIHFVVSVSSKKHLLAG